MDHSDNTTPRLAGWITAALEGVATPDQMEQLSRALIKDPAARDYYVQMIAIHARLNKTVDLSELKDMVTLPDDPGYAFRSIVKKDLEDNSIRWSLGQCQTPDSEPDGSAPLAYRRVPLQASQLRRMAGWAVAMALFCIGIIWLDWVIERQSQHRDHFVVGQLTEQIGAQWGGSNAGLALHDKVWNGDYLLEKGHAELTLQKGARVLIEGPAAFTLVSDDSLYLHDGRLYATVPQPAIGFTVDTANSRIIDLGTEFGVQLESGGETALHVIKGKTALIAGSGETRTSFEVNQGSARMISGPNARILPIDCRENLFVRRIDSQARFIWRGQTRFDLADVVGGGNGFGTGQREQAINPTSGKPGGFLILDRPTDNRYRPVPPIRYVDGVFVPNGTTPQIITSAGHRFAECPPTNGICYSDIIYINGRHPNDHLDTPVYEDHPLANRPGLFMHANAGLTFDLYAIRADLPGMAIAAFNAEAGLSIHSPRQGNAVVWVLVDGQVRFRHQISVHGEMDPIEVALTPSDQFLTLATTDGEDPDMGPSPLRASDSDWCAFLNPALAIATAGNGNAGQAD